MKIDGVHFDVTDLCNAGCPQCARTEIDGCRPKSWLQQKAVSLAAFQTYSPPEFLQELTRAEFCGNFGDPAVVPEMLDILAYCWAANPALKIKLFSNCSVRSADWWRDLGTLAQGHAFRLIAAIDGASQETNHLYRVRTDFTRIMDNTAAFIAAGGQAEWRMLVFAHNAHEVETAQALSKARGFASFRAYPSNRFGAAEELSYTHRGETITIARAAKPPPPKKPTVQNTERVIPRADPELVITCQSEEMAEVFLDFRGYLTPCCHIGRRLYMRDQGVFPEGDPYLGDVFEGFDPEQLNVGAVGFAAARAACEALLETLHPRWTQGGPRVCKVNCARRQPQG